MNAVAVTFEVLEMFRRGADRQNKTIIALTFRE